MSRANKLWPVFAAMLLLASCAQPTRKPSEPPSTVPPAPAADTSGADIYHVSGEESQVHILVHRGGAFARLGHNHVVSAGRLRGRAWLHREFPRSGFELSIPVQSLVVDAPDARAKYGEEFAAAVSEKDVQGTRQNMLRPEVLDAERYPNITLRSQRIEGSRAAPVVTALVTIKDVTREMKIPMKLTVEDARIVASGEFDLLQTDFGMKPFSVALGALEVQDRLHLVYRVVAAKEGDE